MLLAEIVVTKLSRAAVANDDNYKFFERNMYKKLPVRSIDFDFGKIGTEHGIFHVTVMDGTAVQLLFLHSSVDTGVDFELYMGGEKIWPKQ